MKETEYKRALEEESIVVNDLSIDMQQRQALQGSRPLKFGSAMLFDLLVYLARHRGIALTREQLLQEVWGYDSRGVATCDKRTIDVHIHWLREVLCDDPANPHLIQTVRGVGYCFKG